MCDIIITHVRIRRYVVQIAIGYLRIGELIARSYGSQQQRPLADA